MCYISNSFPKEVKSKSNSLFNYLLKFIIKNNCTIVTIRFNYINFCYFNFKRDLNICLSLFKKKNKDRDMECIKFEIVGN